MMSKQERLEAAARQASSQDTRAPHLDLRTVGESRGERIERYARLEAAARSSPRERAQKRVVAKVHRG